MVLGRHRCRRQHLAAQVLFASATGQWLRLKACGNDECQVAFWDASRNGRAAAAPEQTSMALVRRARTQ